MKQRDLKAKRGLAFTLIELLVVMTIIAALAGLVITIAGMAQKKAARSRAEGEIKALSLACENYKSDNGIYPSDDALTSGSSAMSVQKNSEAEYKKTSLFLYKELAGDQDANGSKDANVKSYYEFKPDMLSRTDMSKAVSASNPVLYLRDPFGYSYGYTTGSNAINTASFDLWSTAGDPISSGTSSMVKWVTNW